MCPGTSLLEVGWFSTGTRSKDGTPTTPEVEDASLFEVDAKN